MTDRASNPDRSLIAELPAWMLLLSGMAILGATVLMPAWIESQYLAWQLDVMRRQTDALAQQVGAYRTFHQAVRDRDPVVLKRLAFHQLRARPSGASLLLPAERSAPRLPADLPAPFVRPPSELERTDHGSFIEAWLHQPLPRVGQEIAPFRVTATRLVRLTLGPSRLIVALFGVVCLLAALALGGREGEA